ncbi:MAG TPA: hypothetical protein VJT71_04380 [Pyrinomonadaceae bacterium]|nr:hypothetical protein [Pyrinomonadaceae bacterium]
MRNTNSLFNLSVLMLLAALPVFAQNASVSIGKHVNRIPAVCEGVVPASIEDPIDIPALVKEAYCKGAGDMIAEYSYVMTNLGRSIDKKGQTKKGSTTYEVFIPTLKSGTRGRGILIVTARDGVPVPPAELEESRTRAGERLEKAEAKNARERPSTAKPDSSVKGMLPLGMYTHTTSNRSTLFKKGSAALAIHTFLKTCQLTLTRRGSSDGREILVFSFAPRPDAQFNDNEKYIAQLTGEIWIDVQDRIVTRLTGWPTLVAGVSGATNPSPPPSATPVERPPAVHVEMQRLPEGIWLPRVIRINGADYPKLFDGIDTETISIFSNYIRFSTEIKDINVNPPSKP